LVELQKKMSEFSALDIPVYALSYDEADALSDFQAAHSRGYSFVRYSEHSD